MKKISRLMSFVLVAAVLLLCPIISAESASVNLTTEKSYVSIAQRDRAATIQRNIQNAINAVGAGGTVTVTGRKTNAGTTLTLDIPAGVTVVWQADYAGTAELLISLNGLGTFEAAASGNVSVTGRWSTAIRSDSGVINVAGGNVSAAGIRKPSETTAIYSGSGAVNVTSGNVSAAGTLNPATAISSDSGTVNVSGGNVSATGRYNARTYPAAIRSNSGIVNVTGGDVISETVGISESEGKSIWSETGTINIKGGNVTSIHTQNGSVKVSGGNVSSIYTLGGGIIVSGGRVTGEEPIFIGTLMWHNDAPTGVAAYSAGTLSSDNVRVNNNSFDIGTGKYIEDGTASIFRVETGTVPVHGSSAGLTRIAGSGQATWDTTNPSSPIIRFPNGRTLVWENPN